MKTLADLKRALSLGAGIRMTSFYGNSDRKNKLVGVVRYVVKSNTTGVYLNEDKTATKGSFLDWPKASLLEFDGKAIKIYQSGTNIPMIDDDDCKGVIGLEYELV